MDVNTWMISGLNFLEKINTISQYTKMGNPGQLGGPQMHGLLLCTPLCVLEIGVHHTVIPAQLLTNIYCEVYVDQNYDQLI